ncbi:hypothetical protein BD410DRAFT_791357 [Rickenella mellea]|uniref:Uncharacterized protein n=1 Tax=Rickenella mellea TaxID=50990 RepID=A0A4Y7Q0C3_9AGAM|nr:hypothetical protein BD410DRAFT_791357 [Rickenella mellea]
MSENRKLSGEMPHACNCPLYQKTANVREELSDEADESVEESDESVEVDTMLSLVRSRSNLDERESEEFYIATLQILDRLKIAFTGSLSLKPNLEERVVASASLGQKKLWSSKNLYRQLVLLEGQVPRTTDTSPRAWIEAFFFRASAMLPPDKHMVLIPVTAVSPPSSSNLCGLVDYVAVVASQLISRMLMRDTQLHNLRMRMPTGFFVIEADLSVPSHDLPQAVCRMYACGKLLQKKVVRGGLTNGHDWIFVLVTLNDNYDGATFRWSPVVQFDIEKSLDGVLKVHHPWPDVIAAILLHWTENGFSDLGGDDWFEV